MNTQQYLALFVAIISGLLVACQDDDTSNVPATPQVQLAMSDTFGQYLTDQDGRALYFFSRDVSGNSVCNGGCAAAWPVFYTETLVVEEGLEESDFDTITREDGERQSTYKGWPLYRFQGDSQPNVINGDGQNNHWFVAKPDYSVMLAHQVIEGLGDTLSEYIVDPRGRTLYYHVPDEKDISNCGAGCVEERPVFFVGENLVLPSGLGADEFSEIIRGDGTTQSSYKQRPMYFYILDDIRGTTLSRKTIFPEWTVARVSWARPRG
ncbi:COG4315 family predicted lipoprotein [Tunicatimonas pelagia]|uniref:COG4315 family predicted lipoprotein n=1 Tax=Tunicatimonas pelagia TaxID=931531 RepID=UPI002665F6BD|nr:hypothetical protein [Tunicatimonas pelagia]WKN43504.1 hypothetical protein P0M28_00790 [Tunicatimonas pelagia]